HHPLQQIGRCLVHQLLERHTNRRADNRWRESGSALTEQWAATFRRSRADSAAPIIVRRVTRTLAERRCRKQLCEKTAPISSNRCSHFVRRIACATQIDIPKML